MYRLEKVIIPRFLKRAIENTVALDIYKLEATRRIGRG
jgi:hypothetical protein